MSHVVRALRRSGGGSLWRWSLAAIVPRRCVDSNRHSARQLALERVRLCGAHQRCDGARRRALHAHVPAADRACRRAGIIRRRSAASAAFERAFVNH